MEKIHEKVSVPQHGPIEGSSSLILALEGLLRSHIGFGAHGYGFFRNLPSNLSWSKTLTFER